MSELKSIYPWQAQAWNTLAQQKNKLGHALLLHGKSGIGKTHFAILFSQFLLCDQPINQHACQTCAKCLWFLEGHHPDFIWVTTEALAPSEDAPTRKVGKKTQISVDQIRQLIENLSLSNHSTNTSNGDSAMRVVLIQPAESLNLSSANALLKVLEEPPNNTLFILVTDQLQRLLPTIISRCQRVALSLPEHRMALDWLTQNNIKEPEKLLAYCGGSPLNALEFDSQRNMNEDLLKQLSMGAKLDFANSIGLLMQMSMQESLNVFQKWISDIVFSINHLPLRYHLQYHSALQLLTKSVNLSALLAFERTLLDAKRTAQHPLNQELQLTVLLQQYQKIF